MLKSGIYAISINKKWYVGSAIDLIQRKRRHKHRLNTNKHPNKHLQAAYNKYQEFEFIILEYCEKDVLLKQEEFWISWIDATDPSKGYNKRKIPNSNLGLKFSDETKEKLRQAHLGHTRNLGRACTEEAKIKISLKNKGLVRSEKTRARMSAARKGEIRSEEQKLKISNSLKGNTNAAGHTVSKENRERLTASVRNKEKWPHEKGNQCPCAECKAKRSANSLAGYHRRNHEKFGNSLKRQIHADE